MMLDRGDLTGDAGGIILLNLYSDDGLGSTDNSKMAFNVLEKDADYFLDCAIEWDPITGIVKHDPGKYLRELPDPRESISSPAGHQVHHRIVGSENHLSP